MDNSTPISEMLVMYLDGQLSGTEKTAMAEQLSVNNVVAREYESLLAVREAIRFYGRKEQVAVIHRQMMEEMKAPVKKMKGASSRRYIRYAMGIAAGILLLVGGIAAYNFFTLSPEKIFSSKYQSYELVTVRDGAPVETPAEKAYRARNYKEVIRIHDAGLDHSQVGEFLCGASALEMKDNSKAIKCFNEVLDANKTSAQPVLNDEAEYYLSLGYIRNRDYDYALDIMNRIHADEAHKYHSAVTSKLIRQVKWLKWR